MPPNLRLRAAREAAHLTRNALAEAVSLWLADRDPKGRDVAFDANHLGKIERGTIERPRDHYIAALCAILQKTEAELGFDHASRATPEDVDRQAFLQATLGAGVGALIAQRFPDHDASDLLTAVAGPTVHYRRLSETISITALAPAAEAHLRLASSLVNNVLPSRDGYAALSEAAMLAAWVAREHDDAEAAHRRYAKAVRCAERAQDSSLAAFMLGCQGHYMVECGDPRQGLALTQRARQLLNENVAPDPALAFSASVCAIAHAKLGDRTGAMIELRRAESFVGRSRREARWPWIFAFNEPEAAPFQASTLASAGDVPAAQRALAAVPPGQIAPWRRAEAQIDHANALAATGQAEGARELAGQTLSIARRYGLDRIVRRIRRLNAQLPVGTQVDLDNT